METLEERLLRAYFGGDREKLDAARARYSAGEPLAYILGETVFFDEYYFVTPDVLIPRPDTERVVEQVLRHLPKGGRLLDLCTGSGCIAVSSLRHSEDTTALAVDISEKALGIARKNAGRNGVGERVRFLRADLFDRPDLGGGYDVIVSNPPYVGSGVVDTLEAGCHYEPRIAFDGGADGGDFYRLLLDLCPPLLSPGGVLIFEIGYDQRALITGLCAERGYTLEIYKDYGKNDRAAVIRIPAAEQKEVLKMKNPIVGGFYADPEARTYGGENYIYVTRSLPFREQTNLDCVHFKAGEEPRTERGIVDMTTFPHVTHAVWAPTEIEKDGRHYLVFASNNIQSDAEEGGLEIAVSDDPKGPFVGYLGKPLLDHFVFGAQPIDAHLFKDDDGKIRLYFGGWGHCVLAQMNGTMDGFTPFEDGELFREITPPEYVEGPCMLKHGEDYHFMYSTGNWTDGSYGVCVCRSKSPEGPFENPTRILRAQPPIADGPGHNSYLPLGGDRWAMVYHRRTVGDLDPHHRMLCIDELRFDEEGNMLPVTLTE